MKNIEEISTLLQIIVLTFAIIDSPVAVIGTLCCLTIYALVGMNKQNKE